jgi:hypothetical protein
MEMEPDLNTISELEDLKQGCVEEETGGQLLVTMDNQTQSDEKLKLEMLGAEAGHALDSGSPVPQTESRLTPSISKMSLAEAEQLYRTLCENIHAHEEKQRIDEERMRDTAEKLAKEKAMLESELSRLWREKQSLLTYLLHPQKKINCSGSKTKVTTGHVMATRTQAFFSSSLLHNYRLELTHEIPVCSVGNTPWVHSKREAEHGAYNLVESLLVASGLGHLYTVKMKFLADDYDMVIVQQSDLFPIGFVKVLLPGSESDVFGTFEGETMTHQGSGSIAGHLFDLLVGLQMIGPKNPFALVTNGNIWQLATLNNVITSENLETQEPHNPRKRLRSSESSTIWHREADKGPAAKFFNKIKRIAKPGVDVVDNRKARDREILVSDAVNVIEGEFKNGIKLGSFLAKVFHLMTSSPKDRSETTPQDTRMIGAGSGESLTQHMEVKREVSDA